MSGEKPRLILIVRGPISIDMVGLIMVDKAKHKIKLLFGERVRSLRLERDLSQESFADLCGLDRTYIGGIERGERNVSLVNIGKIASALRLPALELFRF